MFFFSRDAGTTIKPSMTDLDFQTVSVLERLRCAYAKSLSADKSTAAKKSTKYPHRGCAKSPVISRTCKKYPRNPQNPQGVVDSFGCGGSYKETLNFTLLIYIHARTSRVHEIQKETWISWILWIFSGNQAIMRVCGFSGLWIFRG